MGTTIEWVTAPGVWTHRVIKRATSFLRAFHTREDAEHYCGTLPGADEGLYVIEGPPDDH